MKSNVTQYGRGRIAATKAVILARVSSREQEDGYSIDAQGYRLRSYCERKDLDILKNFELVESSTIGDRRQFMQMIEFVKRQKEPIAIVADKVDRVQRSLREYPLLDGLIQQGKIELHFVTENCIIHQNSISQERLTWSIGVIMAQSYVDSLRDNVKRSIEQKIRQGEWISKAPIGYINIQDDRNRGDVILDLDRAPLVRKIFEHYATGAFTLGEIRKMAKEWGLRKRHGNKVPLSKSQLHKMFNNPFYHGQMVVRGQVYDHRYEPIITKDIFEACQAVLKGWKKKPFQWAGKEYAFRGLLTCAVSGRTVTADTKKKTYANGNEGEWTYLRCANPDGTGKIMWVREEKVLAQAEAVLKKFTIPPDTLAEIIDYIRDISHVEQEFLQRQQAELHREYATLQKRLGTLTDLLLDGEINRKEFNEHKQQLRYKQAKIEGQIQAQRHGDDSFKDALTTLLPLLSDSHKLFIGSAPDKKRIILNFVFANLSLQGDKLLYSLRKPFDQFVDCNDLSTWRAWQASNQR